MNKQLRKMMARKMSSYKRPACHGYMTTKEGASDWFKSKVNKKKLPEFPDHKPKDPKYARMSMTDFENKYKPFS